MFVHKRGGHHVRWGCMNRHLRGKAVCANTLETLLVDTDVAVLSAVEHDLLRVEVIETAMWKALAALQAAGSPDTAERGLREDLARLDAEAGRLAVAIAAGGDLPALVALLQDRERRRAHVRATLAEQERQRASQHQGDDALGLMHEALADWRGMLKAETSAARTALQALLGGRLVFTPTAEGYAFAGPGTVSPVITGVVRALQKVSVPVRAPISTTRPSGSCRITTRLASHARRWDVPAGTRAPSSRADWPG